MVKSVQVKVVEGVMVEDSASAENISDPKNQDGHVTVRRVAVSDFDSVLNLFTTSYVDSDGVYPPAISGSRADIVDWLGLHQPLARWVAVDDSGSVVGHVECDVVASGDEDLGDQVQIHLGMPASTTAEIARLCVHPATRGTHVGATLLSVAAQFAQSEGFAPVLCVLDTQQVAISCYERYGWELFSTYTGVPSGKVNCAYVFPAKRGNYTTFVHAGHDTHVAGGVSPDIVMSTTFRIPEPGTYGPYAYARSNNPTRDDFQTAMAQVEHGRSAHAFSSGLAALDATFRLVKPGGTILVGDDVYGGTWRLLTQVWDQHGVNVKTAASSSLAQSCEGVDLVVVETPSNPNLSVVDIAKLAHAARKSKALLVVDNTFATPHLQNPLDLGADIVVHSATKYIGGHSDVTGGVVVVNEEKLSEHFAFMQRAVGAVLSPFDSFLMLRGLRTLGVRMDVACASAQRIAHMLYDHPLVDKVFYPGLASHPHHELVTHQMRAAGAMVSFSLTDPAAAKKVVMSTRIFTPAESLGAVESLVEHPASMTHAVATGSPAEVDPGLVRLSIGVESCEDLLADLRYALAVSAP